MCGKGGKWAISVAGDVIGHDWNCFPARSTLTVFWHAPAAFIDHDMQGSMQQADYSTKEKCLRVIQGGYSVNIRCNQKFLFCKAMHTMV